MTDTKVTLVGGFGRSNGPDNPTVITNIGAQATNFSGTFTGRSHNTESGVAHGSYHDFIASIYTDEDGKLHVISPAGDLRKVTLTRESRQSFKFGFSENSPVGTLSYDSSSGNLTITGSLNKVFGVHISFQGTLTGMYVSVPSTLSGMYVTSP